MLVGKPAVESEADTMKAISDLMMQHQDDIVDMNTPMPAREDSGDAQQDLGLQPVTEVQTKVRGAMFTSVPEAERKALEQAKIDTLVERAIKEQQKVRPATDPYKDIGLPPRTEKSAQSWLAASVPAVRVTWGRIFLLGAIAFALLSPAVFVLTMVLSAFAVVGVFVVAGSERVWSAADWYIQRIQYRDPARAEQTIAWLDEMAYRWDCVLDWFPEGSVDALYMPDFTSRAIAKQENEGVVEDRLVRMHEQV